MDKFLAALKAPFGNETSYDKSTLQLSVIIYSVVSALVVYFITRKKDPAA